MSQKPRQHRAAIAVILLVAALAVLLVSLLGGSNEGEESTGNEAAASEDHSPPDPGHSHHHSHHTHRGHGEGHDAADHDEHRNSPGHRETGRGDSDEEKAPSRTAITALLRIRFPEEFESMLAGHSRANALRGLGMKLYCGDSLDYAHNLECVWSPQAPYPNSLNEPLSFLVNAPFVQPNDLWSIEAYYFEDANLTSPRVVNEKTWDFGEVTLRPETDISLVVISGQLTTTKGIPLAYTEAIEAHFDFDNGKIIYDDDCAELELDGEGCFVQFINLSIEKVSMAEQLSRSGIFILRNSDRYGWVDDPDVRPFPLTMESNGVWSIGTVQLPGALVEFHCPEKLPEPYRWVPLSPSGNVNDIVSRWEITPHSIGLIRMKDPENEKRESLCYAQLHPYGERSFTSILVDPTQTKGDASYLHILPDDVMTKSASFIDKQIDLKLVEGEKTTYTLNLKAPRRAKLSVYANGELLDEVGLHSQTFSEEEANELNFQPVLGTTLVDLYNIYDRRMDGGWYGYVPVPYDLEWSDMREVSVIWAYNDEYMPEYVVLREYQPEIEIRLTKRWPTDFDKRLHVTVLPFEDYEDVEWAFEVQAQSVETKECEKVSAFDWDEDDKSYAKLELAPGEWDVYLVWDSDESNYGYPDGPITEKQRVTITGRGKQELTIQAPPPPSKYDLAEVPCTLTCGGNQQYLQWDVEGKFGKAKLSLNYNSANVVSQVVRGYPLKIKDTNGDIPFTAHEDDGELSFSAELPERVVVTIDAPAFLHGTPIEMRASLEKGGPDTNYVFGTVDEDRELSIWLPKGIAMVEIAAGLHSLSFHDVEIDGRTKRIRADFNSSEEPWVRIELSPEWEMMDARMRRLISEHVTWWIEPQHPESNVSWAMDLVDTSFAHPIKAGECRVTAKYLDVGIFQTSFDVSATGTTLFQLPVISLPLKVFPKLNRPRSAALLEGYDIRITDGTLKAARRGESSRLEGSEVGIGQQAIALLPTVAGFDKWLWGKAIDVEGKRWFLLPTHVVVTGEEDAAVTGEWVRGVQVSLPNPGFWKWVRKVGGIYTDIDRSQHKLFPEGKVTLELYKPTKQRPLWSRSFFVTPDANGRWRIPEDAVAELREKGLLED